MYNKHIYDEQELPLLVAKGNQSAFHQLFNILEGPLLYFASHLIQHRQQAEDYILIAFQKLWERRGGFSSIQAVRAFLYTTVRNQCLNYLKHEDITGAIHRELRKDAPTNEDYIEYRLLQSELLNLIYNEIESLPDQYRQVLKWTYLEELSTSEIASRLSLEESSVRAVKTRALAQLRKALSEKHLLQIAILLVPFWQIQDVVS